MKERKNSYPLVLKNTIKETGANLKGLSWFDSALWIRSLTARRTAGINVIAFFISVTIIVGFAKGIIYVMGGSGADVPSVQISMINRS